MERSNQGPGAGAPDPGLSIVKSRWQSPLGEMLLATQGECLLALDFDDFEDRYEALLSKAILASRAAGVEITHAPSPPATVTSRLTAYFAGDVTAIEKLQVGYFGTDFQNNVWRALRQIPAGETWTYGQLAAFIGAPKAVRAVGRTNGLNPVAIVGPCHRVVGANGKLTGYAGGLARKRWLLDHEAQSSGRTLI